MNHDPFAWGRPSDATYGQYSHEISNAGQFPKMNTQNPIVTGTSVIALKYKDGIVIAADNLGSYGSLLRFNDIERLVQVGASTVVGISGDISDMQHIERMLSQLETDNNYDNAYVDDEEALKPSYVYEYLRNVMYNRRSKMDPLWNSIVVAGIEDGKPFLKYVNLLGVSYGAPSLATGFGAHLAIPLLRKVVDDEKDVENVDEATARQTIIDSMKVLFYRDARSSKRYSMVTIDKTSGLKFEKNLEVENMSWGFAKDIKGYGTQKV